MVVVTGRIQGSARRPGDVPEMIATVIKTDEGTEEDSRALGPQHAIILRFMQKQNPTLAMLEIQQTRHVLPTQGGHAGSVLRGC